MLRLLVIDRPGCRFVSSSAVSLCSFAAARPPRLSVCHSVSLQNSRPISPISLCSVGLFSCRNRRSPSVHPFVSVRQPVHISLVRTSVNLFVLPPVHPFVHTSIRPYDRPSARPVRTPIRPSARPSVRPRIRPRSTVGQTVRPLVRQSIRHRFRRPDSTSASACNRRSAVWSGFPSVEASPRPEKSSTGLRDGR